MYLGSWKIDDYLTFPVNTHTASTGAATDADAVPTYRIYEDETGTAILSGSLAKLDDTNTTGFYTERIQLTAANGFELGKAYTIYISATVATIVGTISHTFQLQAEPALHADWQNGGRLDLILDAIKGSTDDWLNGGRLDLIIDAIKGSTDDWLNGGRLDLLLDAVKGSTDDWLNAGRLDTILDTIAANLVLAMGATFATATDSLEAIRNRGDAAWTTGTPSGSGAISFTYTLTSTGVGNPPIENAQVWATTDVAGLNIVASGVTNSLGQVTFNLDAGTYYFWRQKSGWTFSDPDTEIVS